VSKIILSLDLSTKAGWALLEAGSTPKLLGYGHIEKQDEPKMYVYPFSYLMWSKNIWDQIESLVVQHKPDILAIEETAIKPSSNNFSQKLLEFIHFRMAEYLGNNTYLKYVYFKTEEWRRICDCKMTESEKKQNKFVTDFKKKNKKEKVEKNGKMANVAAIAKDENGKVLGKITRKHINVRRANEVFGLDLILKDNDMADALLMGYAACKKY